MTTRKAPVPGKKLTVIPGTVMGFVTSKEQSRLKDPLVVKAKWTINPTGFDPTFAGTGPKNCKLGAAVAKNKDGVFSRSFTIKNVQPIFAVTIVAQSNDGHEASKFVGILGTEGKMGIKLSLD